MDRNMFKRIGCFILSLLLLSLCGCAGNRLSKEAAQAEMDALLVQLMACVEKNDIEGACAIAYVPEQMRQEFPGIVNYWPARSTDPYEVSKLRISSGDRQAASGIRFSCLIAHTCRNYPEDIFIGAISITPGVIIILQKIT